MKFYPVFLRLTGRRCVVAGGGEVAERKVRSLLDAGARVVVVSPTLTAGLAELASGGTIDHLAREYRAGDLAGAFLAYAATDDEALHATIAGEARAAAVLLNVVDHPTLCDFIVPAVLNRGDLAVAVSTSGSSPALAARIRSDIDRALGPEYDRALAIFSRLRRRLRAKPLAAAERRRILVNLAASELVDRLRRKVKAKRPNGREAGAAADLPGGS